MEDFFRDFFGRIEYCVPVRTTHFQTDRRKNQLVMMVQRACVCMPARRFGPRQDAAKRECRFRRASVDSERRVVSRFVKSSIVKRTEAEI